MKDVLLLVFCSCLAAFAAGQDCPSGWEEFNSACYFVNNGGTSQPNLNWHAASRACNEEGGTLTSVHSNEEQNFIAGLGSGDHLWLGLNQFQDKTAEYEWSDGSTKDYTNYAADQPTRDGDHQCIFSQGNVGGDCFTRHKGYDTVKDLLSRPQDADDIDTFYFGYFPAPDDVQRCEDACNERKNCYTYTFISNNHPDAVWYGECMGRTTKFTTNVTEQHATSGVRYDCGGEVVGKWSSDNCGEKKSYVCKKPIGSETPVTPPPTPAPQGYCPEGWFGLESSNKCFKMFKVTTDFAGAPWEEARQTCMDEAGGLKFPDLASFHSREENAVVTSQLQSYQTGLWIGYHQADYNAPWLWTDNSDPDDWTNWGEGEPNGYDEFCGEIWTNGNPTGGWNDHSCADNKGFVCQGWKDDNNPINTPPPTTPHSCPADYIAHWYGCFKFVSTPTTWNAAEQACAAEGGHLASLHAEAENAAVFIMAKGADTWLGFRRGGDDEYRWTDGWPTRYQNWGEDEPGPGGDGCVLMDSEGYWGDKQCQSTHAYVCKQTEVPRPTTPAPGNGACPSTAWRTYGSSCYYFATSYDYPDYETENWGDARTRCKEFQQSWQNPVDLVSIQDYLENEFIYSTLQEIRGDEYWYLNEVWIGLSKRDQNADWTWSDGSPADFLLWAPGEPNGQDGDSLCVEMWLDSRGPMLWNDHFCSSSTHYVCETEMSEPTPPPTTPEDLPGNCPDGEWDRYGAYCYLFRPDEYESWDMAHGECKRFGGSGANLVTIHSYDENAYVKNMLFERSNMPVRRPAWIGFKKTSAGQPWDWIEPDQEVEFTNWANGRPDDTDGTKNCAHMRTDDGLWVDDGCTSLSGYACRALKTNFIQEEEQEFHPRDYVNGWPDQLKADRGNIADTQPHQPMQQIADSIAEQPDKDAGSTPSWVVTLCAAGGLVAVTTIVVAMVIVKRTRRHRAASKAAVSVSVVNQETTTPC